MLDTVNMHNPASLVMLDIQAGLSGAPEGLTFTEIGGMRTLSIAACGGTGCYQARFHQGDTRLEAMQPGQALSMRDYGVQPGHEARFEELWSESAKSELIHQPGCLFKRLYQELVDPSHYLSLSGWARPADADEASHLHADWQRSHEPYPLARPAEKILFAVDQTAHGATNQ